MLEKIKRMLRFEWEGHPEDCGNVSIGKQRSPRNVRGQARGATFLTEPCGQDACPYEQGEQGVVKRGERVRCLGGGNPDNGVGRGPRLSWVGQIWKGRDSPLQSAPDSEELVTSGSCQLQVALVRMGKTPRRRRGRGGGGSQGQGFVDAEAVVRRSPSAIDLFDAVEAHYRAKRGILRASVGSSEENGTNCIDGCSMYCHELMAHQVSHVMHRLETGYCTWSTVGLISVLVPTLSLPRNL